MRSDAHSCEASKPLHLCSLAHNNRWPCVVPTCKLWLHACAQGEHRGGAAAAAAAPLRRADNRRRPGARPVSNPRPNPSSGLCWTFVGKLALLVYPTLTLTLTFTPKQNLIQIPISK